MRKTLFLLAGLLPFTGQAQHKLRPYAGLHASGDAQMYYLGPSGQLGADYRFNHVLGATAYVHYFRRKIDRASGASFEDGRFDCRTVALLAQVHLGAKPERGLFAAAGVAAQRLEDEYRADWTGGWHTVRRNVLPAFRLGYAFPVGPHQLTAELNATGPYQERDAYGTYTELITQLSLGTRLVW
ncbi:hypothetical protein [Hymenobacter latericus]|uniref:hypothetical protein n=1 Tax=Hymenobacter sp. YIM 151858-1 TaxID=2987688 RepID=UPI0022264726|nr:hypothetical protein [Hymenobacter sp. YIM 151858-1]UYZ59558.1 hypothetical protein OIS50_01875 [Hymenobacter sp. YIM 151858-1]